MIKVTLMFENEAEMLAYFAKDKETPKGTKKEEPKETKEETPKKAKKEISPEKARLACINKIRDFILEDKVGNMGKVIPLMPSGEKNINNLALDQAQNICLALELQVD